MLMVAVTEVNLLTFLSRSLVLTAVCNHLIKVDTHSDELMPALLEKMLPLYGALLFPPNSLPCSALPLMWL